MSDRCDGWLSKIHPPKSLLKRKAVAKMKGPLSRSTPPRAMLMSKSRLQQFASDLTQNSPPPPQLMLATKQSTLGDYFGSKGDKVKLRITRAQTPGKETAPPSVCCVVEKYQHEGSFQMIAEDEDQINDETSQSQSYLMRAESKHQIFDEASQSILTRAGNKQQINQETCQTVQITAKNKHQNDNETSLTHSPYKNLTSDLPLALHTSSTLEDINQNERDSLHYRRQPLMAHRKLDSSMPNCEKYFRSVDCNCNKENCLHGCDSECLFCTEPDKQSINSTSGESGSSQGHVGQMLHDKNISIRETEEYITFSEGMKILSQEHTVNDNFSHSSSKSLNHIFSEEDDCFHSQHTDSSDSLKDLSDSQSLQCVTEDASSQCVQMSYPFSEVKVTQESFIDSQNTSSLHTNGKQIRSPKCVYEDTNVAELKELGGSSKFTLSHSSGNTITCRRGPMQYGSLRDSETPAFVETLFTISTADTANGTQSLFSQLPVLRREQFEQRKAQYLSDLGTLTFSENI